MKALVTLAAAVLFTCGSQAPSVPHAEKQRGMNYACAFSRSEDIRYGTAASEASLRNLRALGVNWISLMPFGFERDEPSIRLGGYETDDSLAAGTRQAHALGMRVLLKPHLWIRGDEAMMDRWGAAEWRRWFADYERFILHYAALARRSGADALSIGNELKRTTRHEAEWRAIIRKVRAVYRGPITYGANFDEVFDVPFWDALDWIGVSGYFPLSDAVTPDRAALVRAWQPIVARLGALAKRIGRPVVFTEIGYRSSDRAAWRQWELGRDVPVNLEAQRVAFEAFFEAVWPQPWLGGAYIWKWFSYPSHSSPESNDYEIEHKPAAEVVRRAFTR